MDAGKRLAAAAGGAGTDGAAGPLGLDAFEAAIRAALAQKGRAVAALDGQAAAGKTTAAALLARRLDAAVVHMDDFFLPAELRTPQRLAQPGGNVHYERFAAEVAAPLKAGRPFRYRVFDCSRMDYAGERIIDAPVVLVEGAYSLHPFFAGGLYDAAAFCTVAPALQQARICARGGEGCWPAFRDKWIPLERAYDAHFSIRGQCGFVLEAEA